MTQELITRTTQRVAIFSALAGTLALAMAVPAAAHHPLGGDTPVTFWHGFLSGIGHPVIGFDHLAMIIAVGVASAFLGLRFLAPAVFIVATLIGCLAAIATGPLAQLEMLVAASVALIGIMVLSGRAFAPPAYLALFAAAGLLHGGAYAGAMVGAEATPIAAYLIGLTTIQYVVAAGMTFITLETWKAASSRAIEPRLAGAVVAGVGATLLIEHVEKLVLPAL